MKACVLLTLNKKRVVAGGQDLPIMTQREEGGIIQLRLLRRPNCAQVNNKQYSFTYAYNFTPYFYTHTQTHYHIYAHNLHFIFTDTPYHQQNTQASKFTQTHRINTQQHTPMHTHRNGNLKNYFFQFLLVLLPVSLKTRCNLKENFCLCVIIFVGFFILSTTKSEYKK